MKLNKINEVWNSANSIFKWRVFSLLSSRNFATLAMWHNDFSSLLPDYLTVNREYLGMRSSPLLNKSPLKSCEFIQGKFTRFSCLIHQTFMAKTKPSKFFEKFAINGPWNSLDYNKCNEKHMKKPWLFFGWLMNLTCYGIFMVFSKRPCMKYIQIFHGVQVHGNLMGWKIHGSWLSPWRGIFDWPWRFSE